MILTRRLWRKSLWCNEMIRGYSIFSIDPHKCVTPLKIHNALRPLLSPNCAATTNLLVVTKPVESFRLVTMVEDDDAGCADNLTWLTIGIDLAKTSPLTELLAIWNIVERDRFLKAQTLYEL